MQEGEADEPHLAETSRMRLASHANEAEEFQPGERGGAAGATASHGGPDGGQTPRGGKFSSQ